MIRIFPLLMKNIWIYTGKFHFIFFCHSSLGIKNGSIKKWKDNKWYFLKYTFKDELWYMRGSSGIFIWWYAQCHPFYDVCAVEVFFLLKIIIKKILKVMRYASWIIWKWIGLYYKVQYGLWKKDISSSRTMFFLIFELNSISIIISMSLI